MLCLPTQKMQGFFGILFINTETLRVLGNLNIFFDGFDGCILPINQGRMIDSPRNGFNTQPTAAAI